MRNKIWGGFLLAAIIAAMMPAFANAESQTTQLGDNQSSPHILYVRHKTSGVKNYTDVGYSYTITEDENNPAPIGNMPTKPGKVYHNSMPDADQTITSLVSLNLGQLEFSKLGDYKLILREISSTDEVNYPFDNEHVFYIYISVRNEIADGAPTGNLVATMAAQVRDHDDGDKMDILFTSEAVRTYIELSKNVTGNIADTGEYFKFIVKINGHSGDTFTIDGQDANVTYQGENITTSSSYVVDDDGTEVYLKHGQTIRIGKDSDNLFEIPINAEYTIQEMGADDYATTVDGVEGKMTGRKTTAVLLGDDLLPDSNKTTFVNDKNSAVLTGVVLAMIPAIVLIVSMFVGALIVRKMKKTSNRR